jgi:hypothetical protein
MFRKFFAIACLACLLLHKLKLEFCFWGPIILCILVLLIGGHRCRNDIIPDLFVVPGLFTGSALFFSPQTKLTQKSGYILFKLANPCRYKNNLKHIVATLKLLSQKVLKKMDNRIVGYVIWLLL